MSDFVIETQIDKLIELLSKRRKIALSEAARTLNISENQLEMWVSTLEDRGVVDLKYPVLGEPEIVLKGILPDNLKIIPEIQKPEETSEFKEAPKKEGGFLGHFEKKAEPPYEKLESSYTGKLETEEKEIKHIEEKISNLEKKISESSFSKALESGEKDIKTLEEKESGLEKKMLEIRDEIDTSKLKEELFEVLVIISTINNIEKIASYLTFIERIILALKAKKAWDKVDKDLMVSTLKNMAENWKASGKENMSKVFEEMSKKIETI
jgi:hypothetical protein